MQNQWLRLNNRLILDYGEGYHTYYIYIITNKHRSTYYIGMTNNLSQRLQQHKENIINRIKTFASRYNLEYLVYYEKFTWVQEAIAREKEIKGWRREKKLELIRSFNENLDFLDHHFIRQDEIPPTPWPRFARGRIAVRNDNIVGLFTSYLIFSVTNPYLYLQRSVFSQNWYKSTQRNVIPNPAPSTRGGRGIS